MRLGRRVRIDALLLLGSLLAAVAPAGAQSYEQARVSLGLAPDPIARSPRLAGMGRLSVVGGDPHNRITLWDFALNPTGIVDADSGSTFELRPGTSSVSGVTDQFSHPSPLEHQEVAAREMRTGFEGWRRAGGVAYGAVGSFATMRMDRPFSSDTERRSDFTEPDVLLALNGSMPYVTSGRMRYALTMVVSQEMGNDEFRGFVSNAAGDYIDRNGTTYSPSNFFVPDEHRNTTLGGGVAASYRFGPWLTAALVGNLINTELHSNNTASRYSSETRELLRGKRPFPSGQATLVGRVGPHLEWGWDGRMWDLESEQRWAFTVSAGIGQDPLTGRGRLAEHGQKGTQMRTRVRWLQGPLELGGSLGTNYLRDEINPPAPWDPTSFNQFLYAVYRRPNADSLALPDSVSHYRADRRAWQAAGGLALHLGDRGLVGAEYHATRDQLDQVPGGIGPRRVDWDLHTGIEYRCTGVLTARAGYIYHWEDQDELTRSNEYVGHTGTLGFSVQPTAAMWSLDAGYAIDWWRADYGDPAQPRGSRQQLVSQLRWAF